MGWLVFVAAAAVMSGTIVATWGGRRNAERWGIRTTRSVVRSGPFRDGPVTTDVRARSAPFLLRVTTGLNVGWVAVTALVFVPTGLLGALVFLFSGEAVGVLVGILLLAASVSGLVLCKSLGRTARRLLGRHSDGYESADAASRWSFVHHGLIAFGTIVASAILGQVGILVFAIPCVVGVLLAALLQYAARSSAAERRRCALRSSPWQ